MRARMTLSDGKTPGAMRQGAILINALLARGCRIVDDPLNDIPSDYRKFVLQMDEDAAPRLEEKPKRGRPRKTPV
jgi:hypothetical protein